jgi:acetate kinase
LALAGRGIPKSAVTARVLCVNLGSRSAKISLIAVSPNSAAGEPAPAIRETECRLEELADPATMEPFESAGVDIVAYRVVRIRRLPDADAVAFDADMRAAIVASEELAPLHTRSVIAAFDALSARLTHARHVAVFDAAFHRSIPDRAAAYGLPYADFLAGWRKVGFHGFSHAFAAARVAVLLGDRTPLRKLVGVHLGGGCSVAAIEGAHSIDTSMGFTPQDGLLMATRSGTLDAGMLLAYMRERKLSIDSAEAIIADDSGLLGLGGSADMREIVHRRDENDARAQLAYDVFIYRVVTGIGAMAAALNGLDAVAFMGGIGEHMPGVRAEVCAGLSHLGVRVDGSRNSPETADALISPAGANVTVVRLHVREDWMMALAAANGS